MGKFDDPAPDFVGPQNLVPVRSMAEALRLLDQWIEAYDHLKHILARTEHDRDMWAFWASVYKSGEAANWTLYKIALGCDEDLRRELLRGVAEEVTEK